MRLAVMGAVFGITFLAELPDKTLVASLVLGHRYRPLWVWSGVAAAFAVHVALAVLAGDLFALLPRRLVEAVVAVLFVVGAVLVLRESAAEKAAPASRGGQLAAETAPERPAPTQVVQPTFRRVALTGFGVIFIGEWGDITQITTANLAARYDDPLSVAVGAVLALWAAAGLAIVAGSTGLQRVPVVWVRRVTGTVLLALAVASAVSAITG